MRVTKGICIDMQRRKKFKNILCGFCINSKDTCGIHPFDIDKLNAEERNEKFEERMSGDFEERDFY